ncbi:hypothetical protein KI387_008077 [Taxus chinensis]|uniref:TIR domain-containing protein n=1 Tax=Taxus chinensis TaxID=29808 RepID=A0AA38CS39_TAXCH|nr:hypothetical protein KI387_008077 [Taxus chinensis]
MGEVFPSFHVFINHRGPDVKSTLASLIHRELNKVGLRVFLDKQELQTGYSLTPAITEANIRVGIRGTYQLGIEYKHGRDPTLVGYTNLDYAGDIDDRKSTSRYVFLSRFRSNIMQHVMDSAMGEVFPSFHVFINHRGPDVKNTLASLIHRELNKFGLRVFLDKQELQTGYLLTPAITEAITSASVHIAIFSPRYAESAWCLNELLCMLDCHGAKIIPIFYDIRPSHLRHIDNGPYAAAFRKHRENGRVEISVVEKWVNALDKVAEISGLEVRKDDDDLGEFLDRVVDVVWKEVNMEPLDLGKYPVGLDQAAQGFQNEILNPTEFSESTSPMVVGIVGLGGSGKSTLVTHLYNSNRSEFKRSCFLSVGTKDLASLQQTLLADLLGYGKLHIENTRRGRSLLRESLRGFPRVLIVFDDIDNAEQIENLLLVKDVLGNGSLILVTSRHRDLLARHQVSKLYDVKLLCAKDAQELFCRHAFDQPKPLQDLEDMVSEFVNICGGFPLALKILGGQLCGNRDRRYWRRQLQNFQTQMPDNILQGVLQGSFESLNNKEKEAFLDIAHFLDGEDKDLAARVLEGLVDYSGADCLDILHQKCLVEFEIADVDFNVQIQAVPPTGKIELFNITAWKRPKGSIKIRMHDLVRDLARQMGRKQFPLRINYRSNIYKFFSGLIRPCNVRGIRTDEWHLEFPFPFIYGLKLLVLQHFVGDSLRVHGLSGDLVWLRMQKFNCSGIHLSGLSLGDLRVLELTDVNYEGLLSLSRSEPPPQLGELTVTLTEECPAANYGQSTTSTFSSGFDKSSKKSSLERAQMSGSVSDSSLPPIFQAWLEKLKSLVKIVLKNIKGMPSLPIKFEESRNLRHVDLSGCSDLEELPHSFTELLQLQYLALRDCNKLLLRDLGKISTLEYLDFGGCYSLKQLPRGTIAQRSLKYLNLLNTGIEQLPENLEQLKNLEQLYIGSHVLRSLPSSLNNLRELTDLILWECLNLCDISKSVEQLSHLERLSIRNSGVSTFPDPIVCANIKVLDVQYCPTKNEELKINAGKMPLNNFQIQGSVDHRELALKVDHDNRVSSSLTILMIKHCFMSKICISTDMGLFPNLEMVDLSNSQRLTAIEGLPGNLIRLNLMNCPALKTLTCLSKLASLKYLNISGCDGVETLNVKSLVSVEVIKAEECWKLHSIEGLGELQKLSHFQISTDNLVWRGILTFYSSISSAIISGKTGDNRDVDRMVTSARSSPHVKIKDIPSVELNKGFPVSMFIKDARSEGAILVCLIADMGSKFEVALGSHTYKTSSIMDNQNIYEPEIMCGLDVSEVFRWETHGAVAHILMWTKDSEVFKDLKYCSEEALYCKITLLNPRVRTEIHNLSGIKASYSKAKGKSLDAAVGPYPLISHVHVDVGATSTYGVKKGWIVMTKTLDLCKQLLEVVGVELT